MYVCMHVCMYVCMYVFFLEMLKLGHFGQSVWAFGRQAELKASEHFS